MTFEKEYLIDKIESFQARLGREGSVIKVTTSSLNKKNPQEVILRILRCVRDSNP